MSDRERTMPFSGVRAWVALAAGVVVLIGIFVFASGFLGSRRAVEQFSLVENGAVRWYQLSGTTLTALPMPSLPNNATHALSDVAATLRSGDTPVLAPSVATDGTTLAVVRHDGTLIPLLDDGTTKTDLAVNADGFAAYTVHATDGGMTLAAFSIYGPQKEALALGDGFSPAVSENGAVLALSSDGLVRIDPIGNMHETLLSRFGLAYGNAALAPDASAAVMPNDITHALDVFSIGSKAITTSYLGSIKTSSDAIAFVTPTIFIVHSSAGFTEYAIQDGKIITRGILAFK